MEPTNHSRRAGLYDEIQGWVAALETKPSGRLMLTNILHAFMTHRFPEKLFRELFETVISQWQQDRGRSADKILETIADASFAAFLCHQPMQTDVACSRVIDDKSLVGNNIDYRRLCFQFYDEVPPALLALLERGIPPGAAINSMRGRRPFAWVTRSNDLQSLRTQYFDEGELASTIRDLLGLGDYHVDHLLLEVMYPKHSIVPLTLAAPTFLEGGAGVIFRARTTDDGWGRTVNLQSHDDGLPEAVHPPVPFTSDFRVRRIGRIVRAPGFEFEEVVARAEYPWTGMPEQLRQFLCDCDHE